MVCREYTYAYGALSIADGRWDSLIFCRHEKQFGERSGETFPGGSHHNLPQTEKQPKSGRCEEKYRRQHAFIDFRFENGYVYFFYRLDTRG
jgi:hypothetical protein